MKHVLITGSSGGIGSAIARELASDNHKLWLHYHRNEVNAVNLAEELTAAGFLAEPLQLDVTNWDQCNTTLDRLVSESGAIDVLIHNAGSVCDVPLPGMEKSAWSSVIDTNLNAFYHVTRPLIMPMIRKRWGRIVSVSSVAAIHGNRGQTNYAAAKAGIIGASRSLAREVANRNICVNVVAPGFIETPMIKQIPDEVIKQQVPMQRAGQCTEVASVVKFLCSGAASYITGEVINVSGGII